MYEQPRIIGTCWPDTMAPYAAPRASVVILAATSSYSSHVVGGVTPYRSSSSAL